MRRKLIACVAISMVLFAISAIAVQTGMSVTLESAMPVSEQVVSLAEYIAQLPPEQQDEWFEGLGVLAAERKTVYSVMSRDAGDDTVFIANSGERYHSDNKCQGLRNARTISAVTKEVALEMDRTPCKLCYPNGDAN